MDLCTVVLDRDIPIDARKYGPIIAPMLGVTVLEAKILVRKGRGILLEDLQEQDARALVEELARDGAPARCVRNEELPNLPPPHKVSAIERSGFGLRYREPESPDPRELPWSDIDVVSMGAIALPGYKDVFPHVRFEHMPAFHRMGDEPEVRDILREGIISKMKSARPQEVPKKKPPGSETFFEELQVKQGDRLKVYADVVDAARTVWLRVAMDEMSYKVEENAVRLGEACGFHILVRDLRENCAWALTEISRKFEPVTPIEELVFMQIEELNRHTYWHAVLHHLGMKP